jgi:hypothetical protein
MQSILRVFRGEAMLADIPDQVFETTVPAPPVEGPTPSAPDVTADPGATTPPATTVPTVTADENVFGIVPDKNVTC